MAQPRRRNVYESEARLQDPGQQAQISDILGLPEQSLTNAELQPAPRLGGAARIKKFQGEKPSEQSGVQGESRPGDIEGAPHTPEPRLGGLRGYPALAKLIGSDADFFVFRRFSSLAARHLLYLQDQLAELEERLNAVDLAESRNSNQQALWNLHSRRKDSNQERKKIMEELGPLLKKYQDALQTQSVVLSLSAPSEHVVDSLAHWTDGIKPVAEAESHFLNDRKDLVALSRDQSSNELLDSYLERNWYGYFVKKQADSVPATLEHVEFYSRGSIKRFSRFVLSMAAVGFTIIPLPLLNQFRSRSVRLPAVAIFTIGFAAMLSFLTKSRTHEIFAAMAACALTF
ncbi:hypothetical protein CC80DRAFT_498400 [Byssothecium circinans]|uniref:DUF6594 domain-containing protein n=1 Tax=Byssothecium circinans TaxID=147558 RepID=A0A6A5T7H5_9PLEO|nr:hypothetical protein CC80DRAFT_498400 [Byssothecium circinans]